nr:hypothetical protein Q903MT_gene2611 [Picea sitchensis]
MERSDVSAVSRSIFPQVIIIHSRREAAPNMCGACRRCSKHHGSPLLERSWEPCVRLAPPGLISLSRHYAHLTDPMDRISEILGPQRSQGRSDTEAGGNDRSRMQGFVSLLSDVYRYSYAVTRGGSSRANRSPYEVIRFRRERT